MKVETEDSAGNPVSRDVDIETTIGELPLYISLHPGLKHPDQDITGAAYVLVGYLAADVRWPNGRETQANVREIVWAPTWDSIAAAVQRCHDALVAMRDG